MIFRLNKAHLFLLICLSLLLILIHARPCVPKQNVVDEETARNKATSANAFAQPPSTLASQKHKNRKRNIPALIFTLLIGVLGGNSLGFVTLLIGVLGGNLLGFVEGAVVFGRGGRKPSGPTIFSPLIKKEDLAFLAIEGSVASLEVIGRGGCGEVLKAELRGSSKKIVAIKKIVQPSMHATELTGDESKNLNRKMCQIRSEINIVGKIRHRNLIPLLAHMSHGDCHYLVYEFMKNGSLQDVLDEVSNGTKELDWLARYKIALGVATGLEHMHFLHNPCIVHRDLKPANVLLDDDMEARISDFGLAKVMPDANIYITGSNVAGTVGYIAPEYLQTQKFTAKSDIYSFGVLLGVLVIGKKPTDLFFHNTDEICLAKWLWNVMASDNPEQAIDSKLMGNGFEHEMLSVLKIACFCTVDDPSDRPSSKDVRCMLSQIKDEIHESRPSTQSSLELSKTILREGKGKLVGNGNSIIKDEIHESRPLTLSSLELSKTISREGKGKLVGNGNSICIREENLWLPDKSEWKDLISQEEEHRWVQSKKSSRNGVLSKKLVYKSAAYAGPHIIIPEIHSNIWKTNLPERLKMLLWHTASDDLPTRERHSKFMTIDNTSCLLCNIGAIESSFHLVFHCHLTRFLWFGSKWNIRLQGFQIDSLENWLKFILDPPIFSPMEADQKVEFLLFGALVLDMVWRARNSILDEAKVISYKDVLLKVFQEHRNLMISGLASIKITN